MMKDQHMRLDKHAETEIGLPTLGEQVLALFSQSHGSQRSGDGVQETRQGCSANKRVGIA
jgi:hypothetical protein